jgi:hypothetical protein
MEAVSTSEMSVNFYQTIWCNIPEHSHEIKTMLSFCMKILVSEVCKTETVTLLAIYHIQNVKRKFSNFCLGYKLPVLFVTEMASVILTNSSCHIREKKRGKEHKPNNTLIQTL